MKFMGSKSKIAKELLAIILKDRQEGQWYVEPMCGGLNMIEHVKGLCIGNDSNKFLIRMFEVLRVDDTVFPRYIPRTLYNKWRTWYNNKEYEKHYDGVEFDIAMCGWVGWMGSFNGRFFDGGYSGHSVKCPHSTTDKPKCRDYITEQMENTTKQVKRLNDTLMLTYGDYTDLRVPDNSIIYCDIPYKNTKQYANSKNFDYEKFYDWCVFMKNKGHKVFISEYEMPSDRFECVWNKKVTNSLHQTNTKRPTEKLFIVK